MDDAYHQLLEQYANAVGRADAALAALRQASGPFIRHAVQELVVSMRAGVDVSALQADETKGQLASRAARAVETLTRYGFSLEREPLHGLVEAVAEMCAIGPSLREIDARRREAATLAREVGPNGRPRQTSTHAFAARTGNTLRAWEKRLAGAPHLFADRAPYNPFLDPGGLAAIEVRTAVDPSGVDRATLDLARPVLDRLEESGSGVMTDRLGALEFELIVQALGELRVRGQLDAAQDARLQNRLQLRFTGSEALRVTERRLRDDHPLSRKEAELLFAELDSAQRRGALLQGDYEDVWDRVDWRERADCGDPARLAIVHRPVQRKIAAAIINEALARAIERPWTASALHVWVFSDGDFALTLGRTPRSSKQAVRCGRLPSGVLNVGERCISNVSMQIAEAVSRERASLGQQRYGDGPAMGLSR